MKYVKPLLSIAFSFVLIASTASWAGPQESSKDRKASQNPGAELDVAVLGNHIEFGKTRLKAKLSERENASSVEFHRIQTDSEPKSTSLSQVLSSIQDVMKQDQDPQFDTVYLGLKRGTQSKADGQDALHSAIRSLHEDGIDIVTSTRIFTEASGNKRKFFFAPAPDQRGVSVDGNNNRKKTPADVRNEIKAAMRNMFDDYEFESRFALEDHIADTFRGSEHFLLDDIEEQVWSKYEFINVNINVTRVLEVDNTPSKTVDVRFRWNRSMNHSESNEFVTDSGFNTFRLKKSDSGFETWKLVQIRDRFDNPFLLEDTTYSVSR